MVKIEVKRNRQSVTQGTATVCINDKEVITFNDEIYLLCDDGIFLSGFRKVENAKHYGEVMGGWGSIKADEEFIIGALYHPYDSVYKYSEKIKSAILNKQEVMKNVKNK